MIRERIRGSAMVAGVVLLLALGAALPVQTGAYAVSSSIVAQGPEQQSPIPTPTPHPAAMPTAEPDGSVLDQAKTLLAQNWPLATLLCLIPLLIAALLLVLWGLRRRARPAPVPAAAPQVAAPPAYLESVGISDEPRRFDLAPGGVLIGRASESDIQVTAEFPQWETVSHRHARVYAQGGRWIVLDLGSMNGVYVNGSRTGRNLLQDGWRLGIGGVEFVFGVGTGGARQ